MANPWSVLGLRKSSDEEQIWRCYASALRQPSNENHRRRARDAFEAMELGLWGKFADEVEPCLSPSIQQGGSARAYDGPLAAELAKLDDLLASQDLIDRTAVRDQLDALFEDSTMQQASTYLAVEPEIADLLERQLPRSEPFVLVALDRFHHLTEQASEHPALARLLDRASELSLLEMLEAGHSQLAQGWRPLAKPASGLRRWFWAHTERRSSIAALYALAGWHNPSLRERTDAGEWAWWSMELSRERTSIGQILVWLVAAILMGAAAIRYQAHSALAIGVGITTFAFLWVDTVAARTLMRRRSPQPFDGPWTLIFASAALGLPVFTRLLPPDQPSAWLVAGLALAIAWGMRLATGLPGGARSSAWLDSTGFPVLVILVLAFWLPIPGERYAMLASYAWLLHAVFPGLRRAVTMALDRLASMQWGYVLAGGALLLSLAAYFAAELDINRESTRMALLITGYALLSLSIYPARPFPYFAALIGSALIGGHIFVYCAGGGEYHPGPDPSAGETLLSAKRGDVIDWTPFAVNGEEMLERVERNNPEAYARLMKVMAKASCDRDPDGGRQCEAYPIDEALYAEVGLLLETMSNRHLAEWTRLEARLREAQFTRKSGACSSISPQFSQLDPSDIRSDHAALVLDIVASGPRPLSERPDVSLPDLRSLELAHEAARKSVAEIEGGPVNPQLRQACINQLVRARTILHFNTDVAARISRGGYPQ